MRKHLMNFKMLLTMLLVGLATISCGHNMPKAPQGELFFHNGETKIGYCSQLGSGQPCQQRLDSETNNWHKYYMLSTTTMMNLTNYIDALIREIKSLRDFQSADVMEFKSEEIQPMGSGGVYVRPKDIETVRDRFRGVLRNLDSQIEKGL